MPVEIERKYLVVGSGWKDAAIGTRLSQGYLSQDPERSVRVRIAGDKAYLTIKGVSRGITRQEFEYPIPTNDAEQLLALCLPEIISKTRYAVDVNHRQWDIDEFHGENEGLVVAEIELDSETDAVELPAWIGQEVSDDPRYYNASLSKLPYSRWN